MEVSRKVEGNKRDWGDSELKYNEQGKEELEDNEQVRTGRREISGL